MSIFQPLNEATKTELVVERLTQAIESGLLQNGERLPGEGEMARMFGVSPITTREALEQLRSMGLVTTRRGRDGGSFVTSSHEHNIRSLEQCLASMPTMQLKNHRTMYITLMSGASRIATEAASLRDRESILAAIDALVSSLERQNADGIMTEELIGNGECLQRGHQEMQIHTEIAAATGSPHIVNALIHLQNELKHLPWLRFSDTEQSQFLAKQYAYAAHLLRTDQNQLFERRITDIIAMGFTWLARYRLSLRRRNHDEQHPDTPVQTPLQVSHKIHDYFQHYIDLLEQWESDTSHQAINTVMTKPIFDTLAESKIHPLLAADRTVIGAGLIPSPDFLPDAPWHSSWWVSHWAQQQGAKPSIQRLRISDNPQSSAFYDFTTQEWWSRPRASLAPHITGPYADYICSHNFSLTISHPLRINRHFAGIAGIDLSAAEVEGPMENLLFTMERQAAIISNGQKVIASTNNALLCGDVVRDISLLHPKAVVDCGSLTAAQEDTTNQSNSTSAAQHSNAKQASDTLDSLSLVIF